VSPLAIVREDYQIRQAGLLTAKQFSGRDVTGCFDRRPQHRLPSSM